MSEIIDKIYALHLKVLKEILNGVEFDTIKQQYHEEMDELNYLNITKRGLLSFDKNGELIGAYPVSPKQTKYQVTIDDVGTGYSMCAIDALGIAYTFMKKTRIQSQDFKTGERIDITIEPEKSIEDEDLYVTYIKSDDHSCDPAVNQCPSLNFYKDLDHIENKEKYSILNFNQAVKHSISVFNEEGIKSCIQQALDGSDKFTLSNLLIDVFEK